MDKCHQDQVVKWLGSTFAPLKGSMCPQREKPEIKNSLPPLTFSLHHLILVGRDEPGQTAGQQHANQLLPGRKMTMAISSH